MPTRQRPSALAAGLALALAVLTGCSDPAATSSSVPVTCHSDTNNTVSVWTPLTVSRTDGEPTTSIR